MERGTRVEITDAVAAITALDASVTRVERRIAKADDAATTAEAALAALDDKTTPAAKRLQRKIDKQTGRRDDGQAKLVSMAAERDSLQPAIKTAKADNAFWSGTAFKAFLAIVAFLALDAVLMPGMTRRAREFLRRHPDDRVDSEHLPDDRLLAGKGLFGAIDRLSLFTGEYVAFWSVIAVFVYYYEVMVRYVFNSPTNWAHESMFLMFGMQYLIAGAYAMLTESHVRVDIFYARFSTRGKAAVDLLTSVFFFIFAGTLLATGWIFARDSIGQGEVSFTEWGIEYWPVKCVIVLGAVLLLLQGIAKVVKDFRLVFHPAGEMTHGA